MKSPYLIGAVSLLVGSGCFLTSSRPTTVKKMIPERDVQVLTELSNIFNESSQITSDFNRLVSFSLGDFTRHDGEIETIIDAVEYVALFEPFDYGELSWKDGTVNRFSKDIWNEAIYYLQKVNPQFKLRAEGRIALDEDKRYRIEALVLTIDRTKEVSKENSESILSASQTCLQKKCEIEILIDQKGISKALSQLKVGESWLGTSGTISAKVTGETTIAKIRNINLKAAKFSIILNSVAYERNRISNDSQVNAAGSIVSIAGETKNFTIVGNLRRPESLSFNYTSSASDPIK